VDSGEKFSHYSNIRINYRIWMSSSTGENILDDEIWALLKAIDESNSLRAGAQKLGISYRKAWGDLVNAEKLLGFTLIDKQRGGALGGVTMLNEEGKRFVKTYSEFHRQFQEAVNQIIISLKKSLKNG